MNQDVRAYSKRLWDAYVIGSLAAIFYLPTLVPLRPTASDSYVFGYNNRAGIVLLLLLTAIGAIWKKGLNIQLLPSGNSQPVPKKYLIWSLLATTCGCLVMYAFAGQFGGFGESSYEIDRIWLLSLGKIPYVDFEWPFGIGFLYGPLLLHKLFSFSIPKAYYIFWAINCLLGTLLLFIIINLINHSTKSKRVIYLLLYCAWFFSIITMGTHYALLRHICPLLFILVVYKILMGTANKQRFYAAFMATACTVILLIISPETAIAFVFACVCIFLFSVRKLNSAYIASLIALLIQIAAVFCVALRFHVLDTVKASGGGADSFPILFAPHILLFFAALFICACYLFRCFQQHEINDNSIGLVAYSIPMTAAVLGRCDPCHVFSNGVGIFLASMFYVSNYKSAWKWYKTAFIVILVILPTISVTWLYLPSVAKCAFYVLSEKKNNKLITVIGHKYIELFAPPAKRSKWNNMLDSAKLTGAPRSVDLSVIYPSWNGAFLAPFGYKPNGFGTYLSNQVDYGHYEAFENANTLDATQAKLSEIMRHTETALLLPEQFESSCKVDLSAERKEISMLFAFPYFGKAVHPESVRQPICNYILNRYRMEQAPNLQNYRYGLWVAKPLK